MKCCVALLLMLLTSCAQSIAQEKAEALSFVQRNEESTSIEARYPSESWHVLRDDEYNVLLEGKNLNYETSQYCPDDFRVFYGTVGRDPASHVYVWFVDIAEPSFSSRTPVTWAAALHANTETGAGTSSSTPTRDSNEADVCADGRAVRHSILGAP